MEKGTQQKEEEGWDEDGTAVNQQEYLLNIFIPWWSLWLCHEHTIS